MAETTRYKTQKPIEIPHLWEVWAVHRKKARKKKRTAVPLGRLAHKAKEHRDTRKLAKHHHLFILMVNAENF